MQTKVINLFGGPGLGKSTNAAELFSLMKRAGKNVELVNEYAKDLTWTKRYRDLSIQAYVFGKQYHRIHRLMGEVDYIVTDSPYLLSVFYTPEHYPESFKRAVIDLFQLDNNLNFLLTREKRYNPKGRNQTEEEAIEIDRAVKKLLDHESIEYEVVDGNSAAHDIFKKLFFA